MIFKQRVQAFESKMDRFLYTGQVSITGHISLIDWYFRGKLLEQSIGVDVSIQGQFGTKLFLNFCSKLHKLFEVRKQLLIFTKFDCSEITLTGITMTSTPETSRIIFLSI